MKIYKVAIGTFNNGKEVLIESRFFDNIERAREYALPFNQIESDRIFIRIEWYKAEHISDELIRYGE